MHNQHILGKKFKSVIEITKWMGALQAQDYEMAKWALGIRLPGVTGKEVEEVLNRGDIIRTHVLRPTWHFVSAEDARWMIMLTAPHIRSATGTRHKLLGLNETILKKSKSVIERILSGKKYASRNELVAGFEKARMPNKDNRAAHLLLCAELDMLICSGPVIGNKQTYALFDERVPVSTVLQREEALGRLASKYFSSHGPATLKDFSWWSGLRAADARLGLESVKSGLNHEKLVNETYWFRGSLTGPAGKAFPALLLPGYDEIIISYKDRGAMIPDGKYGEAISSNGIFRPVILDNGITAGTWSRASINETTTITLDFFPGPNKHTDKTIIKQLENSAISYGKFLGLKTKVFVNPTRS